MVIFSELTGKEYKTVNECLEAEKDFLKKKEEEKKAKEAHQKELDKAYEEAVAACDRYLELAGIKVDFDDEDNTIKAFKFKLDDDDDDIFEKIAEILL